MRKLTTLALLPCLLLASYIALAENEYLTEVISEVYEADGTSQEIAVRGKACIAQFVRYDATRGASTEANPYAPLADENKSEQFAGGQVFVTLDEDNGLIVANSRRDFTKKVMFMPVASSVQSTLTFKAKDGRFRIEHTNIQSMQKDSGYAENTGYTPVGKWKGAPWKAVTAELEELNAEVAACVMQEGGSDDW